MKIHIGSVLVCLLVSFARSQATGGVSFWQKDFTMTCPGEGTWFKGQNEKILKNISSYFTQEYNDKSKGHYRCKYNDEVYHFYVKGKVCDGCYELDPVTVAVVIVADVLLTLGVIFVVYVRARKTKSAGATPKKVSSSGSSGGPPTPSPDYEPLNAHTRSETYSTVHRTG